MEGLIIQDSQDPEEEMTEMDPKNILLKTELEEHERRYEKRSSRDKIANLSLNHKPIFKW